jgi:hypothetical protein
MNTPEPLRQSVEAFMLSMTEPLDPLLSLQLTRMVVTLSETVYIMGYSDGQNQGSQPCPVCPKRL